MSSSSVWFVSSGVSSAVGGASTIPATSLKLNLYDKRRFHSRKYLKRCLAHSWYDLLLSSEQYKLFQVSLGKPTNWIQIRCRAIVFSKVTPDCLVHVGWAQHKQKSICRYETFKLEINDIRAKVKSRNLTRFSLLTMELTEPVDMHKPYEFWLVYSEELNSRTVNPRNWGRHRPKPC